MDKRNRDAKSLDPGNERGPEDATVDPVTSIRGSQRNSSDQYPGGCYEPLADYGTGNI